MLPAAVRMRASAEFSDTVARGVRCAAGPVVVHLRIQSPPGALDTRPVQVGLVVSRAVGNAVVRHRVSRRLRHLLTSRLCLLPPAARLVVRALPASANADSATLADALDQAIDRARSRALKRGPAGPAVAAAGGRR